MKIGVKKVITNFWNQEQVEPKPMSPPKIHFSGYKNTNDNLNKSLLMDFFTDLERTIFREIRLLRRRNSSSWKQNLVNLLKREKKKNTCRKKLESLKEYSDILYKAAMKCPDSTAWILFHRFGHWQWGLKSNND